MDAGNTLITSTDVEEVVCVGTTKAADTGWEVEIDVIDQCSKAPAEIIALIEVQAKVKIDALMDKFPNIEWLAYLLGDKAQPTIIKDIHVPKQDVTTTSVDNIQCPEFNELPVIGVIHSHHGMGTGFSGTDHKFLNQNHNLSIVIAKNGIAGQMRWTTPCGGLKIIPVKCRVKYDIVFDKDLFVKDTDPKINQKGYASYSGLPYPGAFGNVVYDSGAPQGRALNHEQQTYVAGVSVKGVIKKKKKGVFEKTAADGFENEQSLVNALDEAFPGCE